MSLTSVKLSTANFSRFAIVKLACAQVFELTREQERTKQAEASKEEAQYKVYAEQQRKVRLCQVTAMLTVIHVGSSYSIHGVQ